MSHPFHPAALVQRAASAFWLLLVGAALAVLLQSITGCSPTLSEAQAAAADIATARDAACQLVSLATPPTPEIEHARALCASSAPYSQVLEAVAACDIIPR